MSSEVYRKINELDLNKSNYLETILTGEHAGEKDCLWKKNYAGQTQDRFF